MCTPCVCSYKEAEKVHAPSAVLDAVSHPSWYLLPAPCVAAQRRRSFIRFKPAGALLSRMSTMTKHRFPPKAWMSSAGMTFGQKGHKNKRARPDRRRVSGTLVSERHEATRHPNAMTNHQAQLVMRAVHGAACTHQRAASRDRFETPSSRPPADAIRPRYTSPSHSFTKMGVPRSKT